ncbi:carbohydrate kinase family protein [Haloarcula onubensis]|uniref:Carbohydrate kinase family protein n=1 Tax=Haloarcula onubensis TaxID=2950539 RepID=A0ABU2FL62_9EURY|nr:carbohydrate kinase family protein [Halomicroarcula sp. S3CR25-11]MDS0281499.1 carbohydrate kinase family protein [Halomicroarcula sp. S3CR25-11]
MTDAPLRVVCAGHVNWDVTLQVDRLPDPDGEASIDRQYQSGGGSASNVAVALAGLDASPLLLGSVGRDENGWLVRRELEDAGVETALVETDGETAVKYLVVDEAGELLMFGNEGANEAYAASDLSERELSRAHHLHLTSQAPDTAAQLARTATRAGLSVSFDPGRRLADRDYAETVRRSDLLFCNEREVAVLREDGLADDVSTLVVKQGSGGATALSGDREVTHPGFAVDPVDTTGAGDAFAAGFLATREEDLERALAVGNACGALAARTPGARAEVEWRDVEALLDIGPSE